MKSIRLSDWSYALKVAIDDDYYYWSNLFGKYHGGMEFVIDKTWDKIL